MPRATERPNTELGEKEGKKIIMKRERERKRERGAETKSEENRILNVVSLSRDRGSIDGFISRPFYGPWISSKEHAVSGHYAIVFLFSGVSDRKDVD